MRLLHKIELPNNEQLESRNKRPKKNIPLNINILKNKLTRNIEFSLFSPDTKEKPLKRNVPPILLEYGVKPKKERNVKKLILKPLSNMEFDSSKFPKESVPLWVPS